MIGLSLDTLKEERWQRDRDRFTASGGKARGGSRGHFANSDDAAQTRDMASLIGRRVDAIVLVAHDAAAMSQSVNDARAAGFPCCATTGWSRTPMFRSTARFKMKKWASGGRSIFFPPARRQRPHRALLWVQERQQRPPV